MGQEHICPIKVLVEAAQGHCSAFTHRPGKESEEEAVLHVPTPLLCDIISIWDGTDNDLHDRADLG